MSPAHRFAHFGLILPPWRGKTRRLPDRLSCATDPGLPPRGERALTPGTGTDHDRSPQSAALLRLPRLGPGADGVLLACRVLPPLRDRLAGGRRRRAAVLPLPAAAAPGRPARPGRLPRRRPVRRRPTPPPARGDGRGPARHRPAVAAGH